MPAKTIYLKDEEYVKLVHYALDENLQVSTILVKWIRDRMRELKL